MESVSYCGSMADLLTIIAEVARVAGSREISFDLAAIMDGPLSGLWSLKIVTTSRLPISHPLVGGSSLCGWYRWDGGSVEPVSNLRRRKAEWVQSY